jgi:hypothetical protein
MYCSNCLHLPTADRVRWFKSRAAMQRWREELHMRLAEFDRVDRAYTRMDSAWSQISQQADALPAQRAYGLKMSAYYLKRAMECQTLYKNAIVHTSRHHIDLKNPS